MQQVGTADLKNNLSAYLRKIRKGARLIVTDRGAPVAKLVPISDKDTPTLEEKLASLEAEGILTRPLSHKPFLPRKPVDIGPGNLASQSIIEDRRSKR